MNFFKILLKESKFPRIEYKILRFRSQIVERSPNFQYKKGRLAVSHRNMFRSELPLEKPGEDDVMPDFIINGVNKCGTTAASFFLEKHSKEMFKYKIEQILQFRLFPKFGQKLCQK